MDAYKSAVAFHSDFIEGKVVLDVGCGTGILSILCAKAGARKVYAVDASEIALQAQSIVKDNNLSDIITVLHGRVEDVTIDEQVDVIISEWMGYMLLQECMLESIVTARDRWLKPSGLLLPSSATVNSLRNYFILPLPSCTWLHSPALRYFDNIGFWSDVDGIDMSALIPLAKKDAFSTPSVETIRSESILGKAHQVKKIDIYSVSNPELESVTSKFMFKSYISAPLHGFVFWFETEFSQKKPKHSGVPSPILSTAPEAPC
ncbi:putative methyltransferase [Medicago truncatula]|uniref:Putative methyltransferase n=1 Tax=Medicago truncatula TaxID=3880 RepID=A0A396JYN2_MEDTR|nr:putative methyltransferase [Medicago truncatula]